MMTNRRKWKENETRQFRAPPTLLFRRNLWQQRKYPYIFNCRYLHYYIQCCGSGPYNSGSGSVPACFQICKQTKPTGREDLTTHASWLGPGRPTDKENQVKMYKKYLFRYFTCLNSKDPEQYQIVGSGSVSK